MQRKHAIPKLAVLPTIPAVVTLLLAFLLLALPSAHAVVLDSYNLPISGAGIHGTYTDVIYNRLTASTNVTIYGVHLYRSAEDDVCGFATCSSPPDCYGYLGPPQNPQILGGNHSNPQTSAYHGVRSTGVDNRTCFFGTPMPVVVNGAPVDFYIGFGNATPGAGDYFVDIATPGGPVAKSGNNTVGNQTIFMYVSEGPNNATTLVGGSNGTLGIIDGVYFTSVASNPSLTPFTIELNNTNGLAAIVRTVVDVPDPVSDNFFYYAVACTTATTTAWNEAFGFNYNATRQNVTFSGNVAPIAPLLTFDNSGVSANLDNDPLAVLDIYKTVNTPTVAFNTFSVTYNQNASTNATIVLTDSGTLITYLLRIQTIASNVSVYAQYPGLPDRFIGSGTKVPGTEQTISLQFSPFQFIDGSGIGFHDEVLLNGAVISSWTDVGRLSYAYQGQNFKDAEFYIQGPALVHIRSMGVIFDSNLHPSYVGFSNGQRNTVGGVTFATPAPQASVSGDGFTIITDYNNTFYPMCNYATNGMYTERHYLGDVNDLSDYSNFHDITVTVVNGTMTSGSIGGAPPQTGDVFADTINNFLFSFGVVGTGTKLLIWFIITMVVVFIAWYIAKNIILALLSFVVMFVVGVFIGLIPFWFVLVLVILAAAAVTIAYRKVAAGT